jgi:hypothetical protein
MKQVPGIVGVVGEAADVACVGAAIKTLSNVDKYKAK